MTEPKSSSQYVVFSPDLELIGVKVTYTDDAPDVREYLMNLRRDFIRKVAHLDELIARMPQDRKTPR